MSVPDSKELSQDWIKANLMRFLLECPYFFNWDHIPPLSVLNERLRSGEWRPSMNPGVRWNPLEIDVQRYVSLVDELLESAEGHLRQVDFPDWVESEDDWSIFLAEVLDGVPSSQHREKLKRVRDAEKARDDVMFHDKAGNLSELAEAAIVANIELSDLLETYRKKES